MKFGPKFKKLFAAYPEIDKKEIKHNRVSTLSRREVFAILKAMKAHGVSTPPQPTRTATFELYRFIFDEMNKLSR